MVQQDRPAWLVERWPAAYRRLAPGRVMLGTAFGAGAVLAAPGIVGANPLEPTVRAGQATVTASGSTLTVNQASDKAIIDWRAFSIAPGETTRFVQPGSGSIALNRVTGADPSHILGTLQANGQVVLVNPNGVLFGQGSRVDVSGLVATTSDIRNEDFLAGRLAFSRPSGVAGASVVNRGTITIKEGGFAALVAPGVENAGAIRAPLGKVALGSGEAFTVDLAGDGLLSFQLPATAVPIGPDGQPLGALVANKGTIEAAGGSVVLTASAVKGLVESAVNTEGVIRATAVAKDGGRIILSGGGAGIVSVGGTVEADGAAPGTKGGRIDVTGDLIRVKADARVSASGPAGGGSIRIGGDKQGRPIEFEGVAVANARHVRVEKGAAIRADATEKGDGGRVILWADRTMGYEGVVSAKGGPQGGNGGFAEVSGKLTLSYAGLADLTAPQGTVGELLLDPTDITISTAPTDAALLPLGSTIEDNGGGASVANLNISDLLAQLLLANVTITTASSGVGAGTLNWVGGADLTYAGASARTLSLVASGGATVSANISATMAPLDVSISANAVTFGGGLSTNGGNLTVTGGAGGVTMLGTASIQTGAGGVTLSSSGGMVLNGAASITTTSGNVVANMGGVVSLDDLSVIDTTTGGITLVTNAGIVVGASPGAGFGIGGNTTGAIVLTADADGNGVGTMTVNRQVGNAATSSVTLRGSGMTVAAAVASAGTVALVPSLASQPVAVGGAALFDVTQAELNNITASVISIGRSDGTGAFDMSGVSTAASLILLHGAAMNVSGASSAGGALTFNGAVALTGGASLTAGGAGQLLVTGAITAGSPQVLNLASGNGGITVSGGISNAGGTVNTDSTGATTINGLIADTATINVPGATGTATVSGIDVVSLSANGSAATLTGLVSGQTGAAAAANVTMPDATTHSMNGFTVSGVNVSNGTGNGNGTSQPACPPACIVIQPPPPPPPPPPLFPPPPPPPDEPPPGAGGPNDVLLGGPLGGMDQLTQINYQASLGDEALLQAGAATGGGGLVSEILAALGSASGGGVPTDAFGGQPTTLLGGLLLFDPGKPGEEDRQARSRVRAAILGALEGW